MYEIIFFFFFVNRSIINRTCEILSNFLLVCPSGFQCDVTRCIPKDWRCDGHVDCKDQTDELNCRSCGHGMIHCGEDKCISQDHMCDGLIDCPWSQDERNCRKHILL